MTLEQPGLIIDIWHGSQTDLPDQQVCTAMPRPAAAGVVTPRGGACRHGGPTLRAQRVTSVISAHFPMSEALEALPKADSRMAPTRSIASGASYLKGRPLLRWQERNLRRKRAKLLVGRKEGGVRARTTAPVTEGDRRTHRRARTSCAVSAATSSRYSWLDGDPRAARSASMRSMASLTTEFFRHCVDCIRISACLGESAT